MYTPYPSYLSPMLLADFYKLSHRRMYPAGTEIIYSTWTPRGSRIKDVDKVVVFGIEKFIQDLAVFFDQQFFAKPIAEIENHYRQVIQKTLGEQNADTAHIRELHELGHLPLVIHALPEGTLCPVRVPMMTIENTHPKFFWLTNYIETLASCELWQASTSATIAFEYRKLLAKWAALTGDPGFVRFQGHDFSMRGMSSLHSAITSGMGHLTSFWGTDTIPAIEAVYHYHRPSVVSEGELIGTSIPASEHSVQCAYGDDLAYFDNLITQVHPSGFVSIVSDGYDFWGVLNVVLPFLKDKILARPGRVVIRPDSGDPVSIVCGDPSAKTEWEQLGAIRVLWRIFGGHVNEKGYKVLHPSIGLIYGDAITLRRADEICARLEKMGFASTNVVFGVGSYTYQYNTRDTFGFALKSTSCVIDGVEKPIFKDPKTDDGTKKSQKGRVAVVKLSNGELGCVDGLDKHTPIHGDQLRLIYYGRPGGAHFFPTPFDHIRQRLDLALNEVLNSTPPANARTAIT